MSKRKGQPFLFDHHVFDEDGQISIKDKGPPLEFTAPDLEKAREDSYEKGRKAGFAEGQDGMVRQILTLAQSIKQNASLLFAAEDERKALYEAEALHLSYSVIRKVFPVLYREAGLEDLRERMAEIVRAGVTDRALKIEVSQTLSEDMEKHFAKEGMTEDAGYHLVPSPDLKGTACRVSWSDGGAIHDPGEIARKILGIFQETLAAKGIPVHDAGDDFLNPECEDEAEDDASQEGSVDATPSAPDGDDAKEKKGSQRSVPKKASPSRRSTKKKETGDHSGEAS
ncbi:MAG: hypothetical protein KDI90_10670 [Alphaproteobacteria bacterium]|nr:hypothetical protein [Alphaproteobacteria bacterium]MCB9974114.1 hypothetical protein [Rhodospirillales bacterium]